MAIGTSNTFVLTAASTALSAARGQINGSLQAVAQNFYSDARPVAANFQDDGGSTVTFTDSRASGILHYNSLTKALYVNVPTADKKGGEGPGGNFTRVGIGARYEDNIVGATANISTYQIGELVVNLDSSNVRLMVKGANSASNFIDVGIPPTNGSITPAMFADSAVTTAKIMAFAGFLVISSPWGVVFRHLSIKLSAALAHWLRAKVGINAAAKERYCNKSRQK